jgi:chromosome segregation ATPase
MPDDPTKQEVYVTELAGPGDRWVSVTDASRIGRRQEHTIRSWIAQGLLPVHPERVGINKKTRRVRLSDLAKLTPILDPDAGIATDWGTLDLPSIPKQQQQLAEQMTALQQDVTGQLASLGGQLRSLAGEQEKFAEETRQTWHVHQQQYQTLAHRDDEQQQLLQQVRETLAENLRDVDQAIRQELQNVLKLHSLLDDRVKAQGQAWKLAQQALRNLFAQSENTLHQEMASLIAQIEQARQESAGAVENLRKDVAGLEERIVSGMEKRQQAHEELVATVTRLHAHTDQQFSQVGNRLEQLEATTGQQRDEIQKQAGRMGLLETELSTRIDQLATQLAGQESTWQERETAAEQGARQLRRDLDAQGHSQQALQKQFDEERKAREELARQVERLLQQPKEEKGKGRK